ncbi:DUF1638 domain-containing protein [Clostridium sp. PL3]|uniref:DUF1638 domain-containing protein n=1 Tax=Clostridium thailandense TaxID=2794346 RepID=A0A949TNT3_9CLOT|nr:DUF1638 domain-containing protein [Clostridium thailandense]MBV7275805.1 DUF1638 domain-containing protein [Clostridium thailandense]
MKIKLIGCESTRKEVELLPKKEKIESIFLDFTYHADPKKLKNKVQKIINESQDYDYIILTYGRCSNALVGIVSPLTPLIFPGTHDCIGTLLGSNVRHKKILEDNKGAYYFSIGWLEYGKSPLQEYMEYKERYGKKKAGYIIKSLYGAYDTGILITTNAMTEVNLYRNKLNEIADFFHWKVKEVKGEGSILCDLVNRKIGKDILYVKPGEPITESLWEQGDGHED